MFWLFLVLTTQADFSGTWKVREPLAVEIAFETCHFRSVVAYVTQVNDEITGRYEAQVSCTERNWPDPLWRTRVGTLTGSVSGENFSISIDDFGIVFEGRADGTSIRGTLGAVVGTDAEAGSREWSAHRVGH